MYVDEYVIAGLIIVGLTCAFFAGVGTVSYTHLTLPTIYSV